jgi:hypothetical protein
MHYNPVGSRNSLAGTTSFGLCRQQWQAGLGWKDHQDYSLSIFRSSRIRHWLPLVT